MLAGENSFFELTPSRDNKTVIIQPLDITLQLFKFASCKAQFVKKTNFECRAVSWNAHLTVDRQVPNDKRTFITRVFFDYALLGS